MAFHRRQALARFHVPDLEGHVSGCRYDGLAVGCKIARENHITVSLELLELLATVNIPQANRLVTRPTDELRWICRVEMDAGDI